MERSSIEKKENEDKLQLQYERLQQDWKSYKQSITKTFCTSSIDTKTTAKTIDKLLENSPRSLMNSLQDRRSPSEGAWYMRNIDMEVEEIRRERRAAIESGKLKGRRLFAAAADANDVGFGGREEICSGLSDLVQESEVRSMFSYGSDDDDDDDENEYGEGNEEEKLPIWCHCYSSSSFSGEEVEGKECVGGGNGGRKMVFMGWIGIALIAFALGIVSLRSFGAYGDEGDEVILVPT